MPLSLNDPNLLRGQAHIDGQWIDSDSGATQQVNNPANGEVLASVAKCGQAETRRAIEAANRAQQDWALRAANERSAVLDRLFDLMMSNQEDLARILTAEQGKPLAEARAEIVYSANFISWFAEEAKRVYGDTIPATAADKRIVILKQPVGVVACITPWNFPSAMLGRKVGAAVAAGCSVVCKPASNTPLSAIAFVVLAERAGFPPGLINLVCGSPQEIGDELCFNPTVRKLTFTGSTPVGKALGAKCAKTMKRTSMELGGNAPFIVFSDAEIDEAVAAAIASKYRNAGQTCVCANRILVQEPVYDLFVEKLHTAVRQLRIGNGAEDGVTMGPMISESAANEALAMVEDAVSKGARVVVGGKRSAHGRNFVEPTILTDVTPEMKVFREEIFGPIAPIFKFKTEQDAIALANDTQYGLASYLFTRDIGRIWRVSEKLEYGMVGVNTGMISSEVAPFGGIKESGHGREGSKYSIDDYLEIKYLCLGGIDR